MPESTADPPDVQEEEQEERCSCCSQPQSDCNCWVCTGCDCLHGLDESPCEGCARCEICCNCWYCAGCNVIHRRPVARCSQCECCYDTCEGHDEERERAVVTFATRNHKFHTASKAQRRRNPSERFLAVEIEVASAESGSRIDEVCRKWACSVIRDGSLPDTGFEIATAPASGDLFCQQIEELCAALSYGGAEITKACGLHVHVDARDFSYWEVRKLIILYARLEDTLFRLVPASRRTNNFCQPCAESYLACLTIRTLKDTKKAVLNGVYSKSEIRWERKDKYHHRRYLALNLHSWFYRGTVECRMASGSINPVKIINWSILWAAILDFANRHTEKELKGIPEQGMALLSKIAPTDECRSWLHDRHNQLN
jgi:hypothetical protein